MSDLISKKWKIVKPVRSVSHILTDDWKCVCDKDTGYYKKVGCTCYMPDYEVVVILKPSNLPVYEHIVRLHNASLEGK